MQKQTVSERYAQQQLMKGELKTQLTERKPPEIMRKLQGKLKQVEEALKQAHQSVAQLQTAYPQETQLQQVNGRLQQAIKELTALKTATPQLVTALPKATQQQMGQLSHQIEQAGYTLQLVKQSLQ